MYGASLSNTRNEPGINPSSEAAESSLNRNGQLSPSSVRLVNLDPSLVLSPSLSLSGIWPHSFPRLAPKLCMLHGRH